MIYVTLSHLFNSCKNTIFKSFFKGSTILVVDVIILLFQIKKKNIVVFPIPVSGKY